MKKERLTLDAKDILVCENYENGPVIYLPQSRISEEESEVLVNRIKKLTGKTPWKLVILGVENWNNDLSPWVGKDSGREKSFGGCGKDTLLWMQKELFPFIEKDPPKKRYIAGYSLAGLFSLWAVLETDYFDGAASMSGSLWFDGWDEYISGSKVMKDSVVYISLGMKEEKTKDPLMSVVGIRTNATAEILKNDEKIKDLTLKMNPGGHFTEVSLRIADGISWLINR